jgi:hypothetical protein
LHRDDQSIGRKQMLDAIGRRRSVIRLDRQQNRIEWTFETRRIAGKPETLDQMIAEEAADAQAVALDGVEMILAPEQRDIVSRTTQHRSDDRADRACTGDQNWLAGHRNEQYPRH